METPDQMRAKIADKAATDADFRARLVSDPKAAIGAELGATLPAGLTVKVHEEDAATAHLVLPPDSKLGESELQAVAGGTRYDQNGVPIQSEYIPWSNW